MTRRYDEPVHVSVSVDGSPTPTSFTWGSETYRIDRVLGQWSQAPLGPDTMTPAPSQTWRVAARNGTSEPAIYELLLRSGRWRLHRIWN